jgi:hypothetical protein
LGKPSGVLYWVRAKTRQHGSCKHIKFAVGNGTAKKRFVSPGNRELSQ